MAIFLKLILCLL